MRLSMLELDVPLGALALRRSISTFRLNLNSSNLWRYTAFSGRLYAVLGRFFGCSKARLEPLSIALAGRPVDLVVVVSILTLVVFAEMGVDDRLGGLWVIKLCAGWKGSKIEILSVV